MRHRPLIDAVLREPLLHFAAIGGLMFTGYAWFTHEASSPTPAATQQVRVTVADVDWLRQGFTRQWHRPPTSEELSGLAADLLREQLLAREAQALGLADGDTIVRRRLAQKMMFVVEDAARLGTPSDDELRRFLQDNAAQFATRPRISFEHVYFSRERRRDAAADANAALAGLARGTLDPVRSGDRLLVDAQFSAVDEVVVANALGQTFATAVFALAPGSWHGPVESGYGLHLVRVNRMDAEKPRELAEVKDAVLERWREQKQREGVDRYFAGLFAKYEIVVDASVQPLLGPLRAGAISPVRGSARDSAR